MKKVFMLLSIIALVMVALAPASASVSAQKFPGYVTGTQVMNLGTLQASIVIDYYNADDGTANAGKIMDTASDTIEPNQSKSYFPTLTTFHGSVVISSSQPLGAVTNLQNSAKTAGASYVGASEGASVVQIPLLMKNNGSYSSWYSVQNAGSVDATVTIDYSDCPSTSSTVIKPGASKTFYQESESCHTLTVLSAELSSTQPIVVVVVQENPLKLLAYNGFPGDPGDISTQLVMPLINTNNSGITTGIQIQNTSATPTTVTVSYTPSLLGTACTETQTIPGKESKTFAMYAFFAGTRPAGITTDCVFQPFVGSALVSANTGGGLLVGMVNQTKSVYGGTYGAFNPNLAAPKVVMPLLMDRNGTAQWSTGFSVMNVGAAATYVKCTLTNLPASVTYEPSGQLQPNAALTPNQKYAIGVGYVGSGSCTAYSDAGYTTVDASAKLVAVVNELGIPTVDRLLVYEGISVVP